MQHSSVTSIIPTPVPEPGGHARLPARITAAGSLIALGIVFAAQQFGTAIIGKLFGPVMTVFFGMLAVLGFTHISQEWSILRVLNPYYARHMLTASPGVFWLLGSIFLCSTMLMATILLAYYLPLRLAAQRGGSG